jgi:hypothetical protein
MLMLGAFIWKGVWPMIKSQIEQGNIERQRHAERLDALLDKHTDATFQVAERLRQMSENIDGLRRDFNGRK